MASDSLLTLKNSGREELRIVQISSSTNGWSTKDLCPPCMEKGPSVVTVCKGLVCLHCYDDGEYLLWNPVTNEYKVIPPPNFELPACDYNEYHPTCTRFDFCRIRGFGFDVKSEDYKFIKFTHISYSDEDDCIHSGLIQISVYSLNKNTWKEIPNSTSYDIRDGCAISLNGFCYWKASDYIVAFNLATEEFSTFPFPDIILSKDCKSYLVEFDGSLAILVCSWYGAAKCFKFWIMDVEDGVVVWIRKEKLYVCAFGARIPLGFCKNGSSFLFQGRDGNLLEYDFVAREIKCIEEIFDYPLRMKLFSYVESTVKLKKQKSKRKKMRVRDQKSKRKKMKSKRSED